MVFDCDPGEGANILHCARVALMLREVLHELGLTSYVKVSGSKGLQAYVPLNSPITYDETQPLAKGLAELMAQREPKLIVSKMPKRLKTKKVFIDWSQNAEFKTTVGVYSLRAKTHRPYVSMPVQWKELESAVENKEAEALFFTPAEAIKRAEELGDLFKPVLKQVQRLPKNCDVILSSNALQSRIALKLSKPMLQNAIFGRRASRSRVHRNAADKEAAGGL